MATKKANRIAGGVVRPQVVVGPADKVKGRIARVATGAGGFGAGPRSREAGMLIDVMQPAAPYVSGYKLGTYRTSYAYGLGDRTGAYDIPQYFVMMNEQNGGMLYWPVTLAEKYSWYRYWARTDAYIGRGLELLSDLPMSKLTLNMPKLKDKKKQTEILEFFEYQMEVLNMFELCQSILWDLNMIGNVHVFHEWDEKKKMWSRAVMLPPEEVYVFQYPFSENKRVEYRPLRLIGMIKSGLFTDPVAAPQGDCDRSGMTQEIIKNIPKELVEMVDKEGCIVMDSDPTTGSFVHSIHRRRSPYEDLGASVLERVLVPMLQKEHYRYTQLSLASRNMTPKNVISAEGLMPEELDELRTQVDLSYMDPEYSIVTNYPVTWEQIGVQERMLDFGREYEIIENQVFAALGVTRELLTGEGAYTGNKITVEILNTMFLLTREVLKNYIEKQLFVPICEKRGWYEERPNGVKKYLYPKIGFNRLTIRDNQEVFESLFQLYQKGSLPVDILYELFNLNSDDMHEKMKGDLFTVKDATFNRLVEEMNTETGRALVHDSNIAEKVAKYLGLEYTPEQAGGEEGLGGSLGPGAEGSEPGPAVEEPPAEEPAEGGDGTEQPEEGQEGGKEELSEQEEGVAQAVAEELPEGATDDDIKEAVEEAGNTAGGKKSDGDKNKKGSSRRRSQRKNQE